MGHDPLKTTHALTPNQILVPIFELVKKQSLLPPLCNCMRDSSRQPDRDAPVGMSE